MNESDMMFIALGFILAVVGFGIYAMQVFQAYLKEKRRIEEDFQLSGEYEPKSALGPMMVFILVGSTGIMYLLVTGMVLAFLGNSNALPNSTDLVARFMMLMGATTIVVDLSRISNSTAAVREFAYQPVLPDHIKQEKDLQKRNRMEKEYYEKNGLKSPKRNLGRYFVLLTFPETMLIYVYLITIMLMIFGGVMKSDAADVKDISTGFASSMFAAGVLYVLLTIPAIFSMKKSAEMEMTEENFPKKVMMALYGVAPSIIGLGIMIYAMLPLLS